jgi:hypothetical protein
MELLIPSSDVILITQIINTTLRINPNGDIIMSSLNSNAIGFSILLTPIKELIQLISFSYQYSSSVLINS